ncbi:CRAL-TRIO domain-containing protein [Xylaria bambusicola]|uniref:CRAL-TRIO domain-containing protein n=1 Tax=Xylaria bambusicola TaxID=326684 RepID=UPI002008E6BB|nr:CRAL-TRIO domain-containing protein [Xylaria bambusicola]KAI0527734.1 CRAL-TRIO domain-containing protein [Xylaria bambusicola]
MTTTVEGARTIETGYVGNLTREQETKLQQLWRLLFSAFEFGSAKHREEPSSSSSAQESSATSSLKEGSSSSEQAAQLHQTWMSMIKQENPDAFLLRFLRARKWDVNAAFTMLRNALIWRRDELHVDEEVLAKGEAWCAKMEKKKEEGKEKKDAHDFLEQLRLGKVYLRGTDRRGRPVGYVRIALHKPGAQSEETLEKLIVQTIETARCLFAAPSTESFCVVFDLTDFSLSNMEWQPVKFIIRAFEANYPECLGALLIHNAPWIFSGIWKVIRGLLDPVVAAKVDFTRNTEGLEKYIPRENIISDVGGGDDWAYSYVEPSEDEDIKISLGGVEREEILSERREIAERFLSATQEWIKHEEVGEHEEAAIQAQLRINAVEALWSNYWKLDPYVRSRTNLDRTGVIGAEGEIEMYPERRKEADDGGGSEEIVPTSSRRSKRKGT